MKIYPMLFRSIIAILLFVLPTFSREALTEDSACTLKVGAALPLSGAMAEAGAEIRNALLLGLEDLPDSKRARIKISFEDTAYSQSRTAAVGAKLISQDGVNAVVTVWDSSEIIAPIAEKNRVITFAYRWNHDVTTGRPFTFTFESTYESWIDEMLKLMQSLGRRRLASFYEQVVGCEIANVYLKKRAADFQIEVTFDGPLPSEGNDFRALLLKAKTTNVDSVFNCANAGIIDPFLKQLRQTIPGVYHTGYYANVSDLSLIEGMPYVDQLGFFEDFHQKYEKRFGRRPKYRAPHAYETVRLFSDALEHSCKDGKVSNDALANFLSHVNNRPSVLGSLTTGPYRNIEHPNYLKIVRGGKVVPYP